MSIRKLLAMVVALAMLLSPPVTGAAMAASTHHDMQMMEAGRCETPPASSGDQHKMAGTSCCIAMCTAVAVAPSAPVEILPPRQQMTEFSALKTYRGLLTEIATPPPRHT